MPTQLANGWSTVRNASKLSRERIQKALDSSILRSYYTLIACHESGRYGKRGYLNYGKHIAYFNRSGLTIDGGSFTKPAHTRTQRMRLADALAEQNRWKAHTMALVHS